MTDIEVHKTCMICNKLAVVYLSPEDFARYTEWAKNRNKPGSPFIQDILPGISVNERETLLSGSHSECFDKVFPPDDEEEYDWEPDEGELA